MTASWMEALVANIFPNITFSAICLILLWKPGNEGFPMIPISLVYSFSGMNDSFMNGGIGGQYLPQYNINADIGQCYSVYCSIFCAQFTPIVSQFWKFALLWQWSHWSLLPCPYSDMPRLLLVDKARVIGQIQAGHTKKWMVEFVCGVDQENVLLGQHAVQDWTRLDCYGTSWGELFVPESPSPPCSISVRLW